MLHMRNKRHTEINGCVDKDMRCVMVCEQLGVAYMDPCLLYHPLAEPTILSPGQRTWS